MQKYLTVHFAFAFFVVVMGLAITPTMTEAVNCEKNPNHRNCPDGPEPPPDPDDGSTTGTPVRVTFDDWESDSIQSDGGPYEHEGTKTGVTAILDGAFNMILRAGGERKLFIDFGDIVECPDNSLDCVLDDSAPPSVVKCPFPSFDPNGTPPFRTTPGSCSALVQAALTEHDVFDPSGGIPDPDDIQVHVEDMLPTVPGEDIKVRPFQEYDVFFNLPRSKGNKVDGWIIAFSAKQENCSVAAVEGGRGLDFPDFLNIIAIDTTNDAAADTWHVGTFDENGDDTPRLACLLTSLDPGQPDDVVGFFFMNFMYTIEIIQP